MLETLTPEQRDHMLQLLTNGTAQAPPPTTSNETQAHHTRPRLYDPVGTGRLEEETADNTTTGVHTQSIDNADEMVIGGTTHTAVHAAAPALAPHASMGEDATIACAAVGLPANCTQEDILDAIDLKADEEAMALLLNATASSSQHSGMEPAMAPLASSIEAALPPQETTPAAATPKAPAVFEEGAPAPAPLAPGPLAMAVLAAGTPAPPNATIIVVNPSGGSNGTTIAVVVLVSVILAGIGAFVLHKHYKERRARALHQELESGGDWDWRDGEGQTVELAKSRALFDGVDEEFQSLNGKAPSSKSAPKVLRAAKLK